MGKKVPTKRKSGGQDTPFAILPNNVERKESKKKKPKKQVCNAMTLHNVEME